MNEERFNNYLNSINEVLEMTVKFHSLSKYCRKIDFQNNKDYEDYKIFIDNLFICSNYALISCLNKVIDKTGFSIFSLIEHVRNYPQLFNKKKENTLKEIKEVENNLQEYEELIENLIKHRDEFHAHLDKKAADSEDIYNVFFQFEVKEEEIDNLIIALCNCVVKINFIFSETYENVFIQNLLNDEENLYFLCDIKKVFDLMRSSTIGSQPSQVLPDLYYDNLTRKY